MRYMMYHHHYTSDDDLSHERGKMTGGICRKLLTADFSEAEKKCPRNLAIGKIMREAAEVLG